MESTLLWLIDIIIEMAINTYFAISGQKESKDAIKSMVNSSTINSIRDTLTSYFNKDVNRLNDLIRAYQRKDAQLANSILMSSPVGSRIVALQKQIAANARRIDNKQHEIESTTARIDDVTRAYDQAANLASTNPEIEGLNDYYYAQELASGTPNTTAKKNAMVKSLSKQDLTIEMPSGNFTPISNNERKEMKQHEKKIRDKFKK